MSRHCCAGPRDRTSRRRDYQKAVEQERVAAGLADYAPSDVPPATDPLPPEAADAADLAQRGLLEEEPEDNS